MQRDEKNKAPEPRRYNSKRGVKGGNVTVGYQRSQVPSSSSEPTLSQANATIGPSLRETSSWSNPSDTAHISLHRNVQFNVVDAMNPVGDMKGKRTRNDVDLEKLREEFRSLIIPLMQKVVNENPPDLIAYCAQYFQDLLASREEEKRITNVHEKEDEVYLEVPIEKSSSLPTLYQMNDSFGPLLFENVSWNETSSSPWRVQNKSNLKAAEINKRDRTDNYHNKDDGHLLKEAEIKPESVNKLRSVDRKVKEKRVSFSNNIKYPENENTKSDSHSSSRPSNYRKRWPEPENRERNITKSLTSSGTDSSSDSDDLDSSYNRFQSEDTIPLNPKEDSIAESSHEHGLPYERDRRRSDYKRKNSLSGRQELNVEEVEGFARGLFQTLRNNILQAEAEINDRIQQIKGEKRNSSANKQNKLLPRKKRSITTLDSTFKEGDKDSESDRDMQKRPSRKEKDPPRNHKRTTDASDVQSRQRHKNTEHGSKNRNDEFSEMEGFTNPAFSLEQDHSSSSIFMRPRKNEWIPHSTTDFPQQSGNVRAPTNPERCIRPIPTYPSSSSSTRQRGANISNIGDGDVLSLHQNVCSIAIETDNPTTTERSAGPNRIRPNSRNDDDSVTRADRASSKKAESYRNSSTSSLSKGTGKSDSKAPGETSQSSSQETSGHNVDLERVRTSTLNPCAPVFSPNSRRFFPQVATTSIDSEDDGRRRWDTVPRLDVTLLTDTDVSIDAVAWDCLRARNLRQDDDCVNGEFESTAVNGFSDYEPPESRNTNVGDRTPSTDHDDDKKLEQSEPSLNPACGDFVLSEDNEEKPLQNGTAEENSNSSPGSDDSGKDKVEESEQKLDEGLNFACLSDSGSSVGFSSELSEEEEYEEN